MQGGDEVSIEELSSNLSLFKDQLHQVRQLLNDEDSNSEYVDMGRELSEILGFSSTNICDGDHYFDVGILHWP